MSASTTTTTSGEAEIPDYWQRVDSPFSKSTIFAYAGGMLAFGAVCGAAAALVIGQRPPKPSAAKTTTKAGAAAAKAAPPPLPHTPVKITPSSAVFAIKAFAAGTALCLTGALAVRWVVYTSMGVSTVEEFADKMRRWAPEKAKKVGLVPSRESAYWTQKKLEEEGGAGEEGRRAIGVFEQWFGVKFDEGDNTDDEAAAEAST